MKRLLPSLLIFIFLTANAQGTVFASLKAFSCLDIIDIPISECQALEALYISTNGADWYNNTNWLSDTSAANWFGITLYAGSVSIINLRNNNLSGPIPGELK